MRLTQKVEHKKSIGKSRLIFAQRCSILQNMMDQGLSNSEFLQSVSHATIWSTEPEKQCNINEFFEHSTLNILRFQIHCPFQLLASHPLTSSRLLGRRYLLVSHELRKIKDSDCKWKCWTEWVSLAHVTSLSHQKATGGEKIGCQKGEASTAALREREREREIFEPSISWTRFFSDFPISGGQKPLVSRNLYPTWQESLNFATLPWNHRKTDDGSSVRDWKSLYWLVARSPIAIPYC